MKKFLIAVLVLILIGFTFQLPAGEKGNRQGGQMDPERRARMQELLGLTAVQMEQMREIRQNGGTREDMRAVLTNEQRALMDEHRRNRKAQGGSGDGRRDPPESAAEPSDAENG